MDYDTKDAGYFDGARRTFLDRLPQRRSIRVLEVGCGTGATGTVALTEGLCSEWCGIELVPAVASRAAVSLTEVVVGDVETVALPWPSGSFDVLALSEVLEHLTDPAATLRRLRPLLVPGGIVLAGSPNVAHFEVILMLFRGQWHLEEAGTMDRTHLRWFTPRSYRELFEANGYRVECIEPAFVPRRARWAARLGRGRLDHLLWRQIVLRARV